MFCKRCRQLVPPERRTYCTEACADSAKRERMKLRAARIVGVAKFRRYPKESV